MGLTPASGLLAATALHLGFQAVVSAVVYPALAEVPPDRWDAAHAAHSRRITVVVAPAYAVVGVACLRVLRADARTPLLLLAATGSAVAAVSTALVAAPTHGRLGREGPVPELVRRLRVADAVRLAGAGLAAGTALAAVISGRGERGAHASTREPDPASCRRR